MAAAAGGAPADADKLSIRVRGDGLAASTLDELSAAMTVEQLKKALRAEGADTPLLKMQLFALDDSGGGYDAAAPLDPDATLAVALRGRRGVFVKDMRRDAAAAGEWL